jgi:hypothetical protein
VADSYIHFSAPAILRKYASLGGQRRTDVEFPAPYLLHEGTLDECITKVMSKPLSQHSLYEIHTNAQPPLVTDVLGGEHIVELARLRQFL